MTSAPMVSIILLVKNGADTLQRCLEGIFSQQSPVPFEVIVIDSGSRDASLEIARRYPLQLVEIPPAEFNYGTTKNFALGFARGELVVFLSQDAIPADDRWLAELIAPMLDDATVAGVYSRQVENEPCNVFESYQLRTAFGDAPIRWSDHARSAGISFSNASSGIRRSMLEEEPFRALPFAEDRVWAVEMLRRGRSIVYNPASRVIHSHDFTVGEYYGRTVKNAVTKRVIDGYRASLRPLASKFLNPLGIARMLRAFIRTGESVGLTGIRSTSMLARIYIFHLAEFWGNVVGSRWRWKGYRS